MERRLLKRLEEVTLSLEEDEALLGRIKTNTLSEADRQRVVEVLRAKRDVLELLKQPRPTPQWLRDFFILPLVVGLVVGLAGTGLTVLLPMLLAPEKELSYSIDGPVNHLSDPALGHVKIKVNETEVGSLLTYKVHLWNSGDKPLKVLPARFVFQTQNSDFQILNVSHKTNPAYEFGAIREEGSDTFSKRFVYELLNPVDKDTVTFIANQGPSLTVFAKAEGLSVQRVEVSPGGGFREWTLIAVVALATIVTAVISILRSNQHSSGWPKIVQGRIREWLLRKFD